MFGLHVSRTVAFHCFDQITDPFTTTEGNDFTCIGPQAHLAGVRAGLADGPHRVLAERDAPLLAVLPPVKDEALDAGRIDPDG